ncbi:hypothetical protein N0V90_005006 [Kalmusia sp. IMI 367209]|nr:hypothetical protein N0V90_005006 [Kalmusia sp. IMI 367209]
MEKTRFGDVAIATLSFLELSDDILHYILDFISLQSDFNNICSTSKRLQALATPRLYRKIIINVNEQHEVECFIAGMFLGGSSNLKYTRSLTLTDNILPHEPSIPSSERLYFNPSFGAIIEPASWEPLINSESPETDLELARSMYLLINLFPKNCLETFRYLSLFAPNRSAMSTLYDNHSQSLKHLHISVGDAEYTQLFDKVRTLDLVMTHHEGDLRKVMNLLKNTLNNPNLERLCIANLSYYYMSTLYSALTQGPGGPRKFNDTLKELTINGIEVNEPKFTAGLLQSINLDFLTRLTLWDCLRTKDLDRLTSNYSAANPIKLKHFAFSWRMEDNINARNLNDAAMQCNQPLHSFLILCTSLESLCLKWHGISDVTLVRDAIIQIGSNLRLLSLHYKDFEANQNPRFSTLKSSDLAIVCERCPKLQQLGFQMRGLDQIELLAKLDDGPHPLDTISRLRDLRVLHLRHTFEEPISLRQQHIATLRTFHLQQIADFIFRWIFKAGSKSRLEALAIGQKMLPPRPQDEAVYHHYTPLHCYLRTDQTTYHGIPSVKGTLVESYLLRSENPYTEILDWNSNWHKNCKWMYRIPGRFHDD